MIGEQIKKSSVKYEKLKTMEKGNDKTMKSMYIE